MIELNYLHICKDYKIVFQTVKNIRSEMKGISYKTKWVEKQISREFKDKSHVYNTK